MTRRTLEIVAFFAALLLGAMSLHAWLASRDEQQRLTSTLASQKQLLDAADARERSRESALDATLAQVEQLKRTTQTPEQILRDLPKYLRLPQPIALASSNAGNSAATPTAQQGTDDPARIVIPSEHRDPRNLFAEGAVQTKSASADEQRNLSASPEPGNRSTSVNPALSGSPHASAPNAPGDLPFAPAAQIPVADLRPLFDYVQDCRACQAQLAAAKQNQTDDATKIAALTRERDAAITASKGGTFLRRLRRNALWFGIGAAIGAAAGYKASLR